MKKKGGLALLCAVLLAVLPAGCAGGETPPLPDWLDSGTEAEVIHTLAGRQTLWTAEGEGLDELRAWAAELEYRPYDAPEGQSPRDAEGGEVYDFAPADGEGTAFSYVVNGPEDAFLLLEGAWYRVAAPVAPPEVPGSFSWEEDAALWRPGDPGVVTEGFVQTAPDPVDGVQAAVHRAEGECTVPWDTARAARDTGAEMWRVDFFTAGTAGGGQTVWLGDDGVTRLVAYGE